MNIVVCKNYDEMSTKAAELVAEKINANPNALISFPGGDTPIGMFREFVNMVNNSEVDISSASYVSLDEWVTLSKEDEGSCGKFTYDNLINPLQKSFAKMHIINGANKAIEDEVTTLNSFISNFGPLTVSVLGIGMNGHLGFNEDGVDFSLNAHITPLSKVTTQVMKKYFGDNFKPTMGITQGINQILASQRVILLANGEHKADIIKEALTGSINSKVPASILQNHSDCFIVIDEAAASRL